MIIVNIMFTAKQGVSGSTIVAREGLPVLAGEFDDDKINAPLPTDWNTIVDPSTTAPLLFNI